MRPVALTKHQRHNADAQHKHDLQRHEDRGDSAADGNGGTVDGGGDSDGGNRDDLDAVERDRHRAQVPVHSVVLNAPPVTTFRKIPSPNASAAMPPVLPMKNRIHPKRKPASRPYASRMRTYSPPARGIIALSSA